MGEGKKIFRVRRKDEKFGVHQNDISSDGRTFISVEHFSKDVEHSQLFADSETKEFFEKYLRLRFSNYMLKKHARAMFKEMFGVQEKNVQKIDEDGSISQIFHLLKEIIHGKTS